MKVSSKSTGYGIYVSSTVDDQTSSNQTLESITGYQQREAALFRTTVVALCLDSLSQVLQLCHHHKEQVTGVGMLWRPGNLRPFSS
ncbi:hypothetical protein VTJ49DRAFT_1507 [Mycothermus thermophilus]|uniref:Uncharacterized protein n=1 Tax=Humicola insolens TaxID=85995 RepID=A0ABR3VCK9_HUMIN